MVAAKAVRRPLHYLVLVLVCFFILNCILFASRTVRLARQHDNAEMYDVVTAALGLTDLCVATEARYTRHPAVSDPIAPFMDHPGAIEHFPTGSFWVPPSNILQPGNE